MTFDRKPTEIELMDLARYHSPEADGMDVWLDHLETMLTAIHQRRMTRDQVERYTRLIHGAEADAVSRKSRRKVA